MLRISFPGLFIGACLAMVAQAQDNWPRFRGPNADGVAPDNAGLPRTWSFRENVMWVVGVPGWGWSCPVVWGDRVLLTSVISDEENSRPSKGLYLGEGVREPAKGVHHWMVYCFDLSTGEELWRQEAHTGKPEVPRHPKSTYASETPTTDGERLYVLFGDLGLYGYSLTGELLWSQAIKPRKTFYDYGAAASPVCHDGQVIVVYDNLEASWIASFDGKTGAERWRTPRDETHSWATPLVWMNELRTEIVVPGFKRNRSYSLDGKLLWEFDGKMSSLVIPSPFAAHGLCYIASGYVGDSHRPTFAVRPGASGDFTPEGDFEQSEYIAWHQGSLSSYNPSQIVYGDYLYTLYDRGFLTCHDARTGKEVHGKRRFTPRGSFTASPWAYNGHLFFLSEDGLTYVVKAGPEFEIVATNDLKELCLASPAVAGNKLLIRTASRLYCITEGARLAADGPVSVVPPRPRPGSAAMDIWAAAAAGNRDEVARNLAEGTSVDARSSLGGMTPLMIAALLGQAEITGLLIDQGADVSLGNSEGNTALHIASFFAHPEIVKRLLQRGAAVDARNAKGETPLVIISGEWSPALEGTYRSIGELLHIELDLERVRLVRPEVAAMLREAAAENAGRSVATESFARAKARLQAAVDSGEVAGGVHMVVIDGKTVHIESAGVCDIEERRPFRSDTVVRIYSMTKPITSVAAMALFEQGEFQLDDPVGRYIPAFERTTVLEADGESWKIVPGKRKITVRDVFRHTTGYSYGDEPRIKEYYEREGMRYRPPHGMMPPAMTIEEAAGALARIPALHHPGERFTYGFNTDLLGRLIEIWSGKPLDEYMRQTIFRPLEMVDTGFSVKRGQRDRFASCHTWQDGKLVIADKASESPYNQGFAFLSGGGGLVSTIRDYANFCQMLVDGGEFEGKRVLKEETVKLLFTDQLDGVAGEFRFGLGFAVGQITLGSGDRQREAAQYSWGGYASTDFRIVPEAKIIQILMRQRVPSSHGLAGELFPIVYEGLK